LCIDLPLRKLSETFGSAPPSTSVEDILSYQSQYTTKLLKKVLHHTQKALDMKLEVNKKVEENEGQFYARLS
jgi:hypothetical protein